MLRGTARASTSRQPADYVWLEGESPTAIPGGMAVGGAAQPSFLSGGKWLIFTADADEVEKKVPAEGFAMIYPFRLTRAAASKCGPASASSSRRACPVADRWRAHGPRSRPTI